MDFQKYNQILTDVSDQTVSVLMEPGTYIQLALVVLLFGLTYFVANRIRRFVPLLASLPPEHQADQDPVRRVAGKLGNLIFPLLTVLVLSLTAEISDQMFGQAWISNTALILSMLLVYKTLIQDFVKNEFVAFVFRWVGLPLLFLHMVELLGPIIEILESMRVTIGNIEISAYGFLRVALFGSVLFWLGRVSNSTGQEIIRRQDKLDFRTKEVAAKMLQVAIIFVVFLLLLQVMGINLTALAVFGGAVGVGLGFGLQAIASNFISGIIILLDRSISVNDFIELEDGRTGIVRELTLRSTTLETFDGKDIIVPNEKFMTESFSNWTHKNKKQRYRVDFSVAYDTDIRKLVEIIKATVAEHPQVISGDDVPFEERPDCEIDSFGDSGVNMFVEFWMQGIDDGKNRVGGDLLLMIFEAMREHGFEIPFPQREVRILNENYGK
ncbi:mechanosensitive ion channel domain-containing protein [Neptuniibacter sp. CAU 1671]|uniref:mechanosensitive ion channel family protein n=1 Tax=Neptuniibacter sp. CAU 1671 TaxID=3032593 RepID=UPI0023DB626D|nr:mechanosensitive ion channel domain-containing protein [Neptuniibacter sp. CAU 1671]MDF2183130.1 mechanosensitive ion channel [Neptuniibacter sp. CAU 1671]